MRRAKLLLKLAQDKGRAEESHVYRLPDVIHTTFDDSGNKNKPNNIPVCNEKKSESSLSKSIISETENDGRSEKYNLRLQKKGEIMYHETTSNSQKDFEDSGSDYVPSECGSDVIPYFNKFQLTEESSDSKVVRYLESLKTPDLPKEVKKEKVQILSSIIIKNANAEPEQPLTIDDNINTIPFQLVDQVSVTEQDILKISNLTSKNDNVDDKLLPTKKSTSKERTTICPLCYQDVFTHFTRHLFRHHQDHKDVLLIKSMKPGSKDRLALVAALRKQGYFYLKTERDILHPVRRSKNTNVEYYVCTYCLGHYSKRLLHKHVKSCKNRPKEDVKPGQNCLSKSQTFLATVISKNNEFLKHSHIKKEVFDIMRADHISCVAKSDTLICLYGEALLNKHKRQQIATVVSNKIREMARLLIAIRSANIDNVCLFDVLKPEMFQVLIAATKEISGYDVSKKSFKAPSLALHMGTNLKIACDVAFKIVVEKRNLPNIIWNDNKQKKSEIKDLKNLIEGHWCNEISSLALKTLKEKQWEKPISLPLNSDIQSFQNYTNDLANDAYRQLENNINISANYKKLSECVLAQVIMFNRKRVGDVQYLKIENYNRNISSVNQEAFLDSLTNVEKMISKSFKRVVTGGKGSRPVPILFSKLTQKYIDCLLKIRYTSDIVPKCNPYLFANPGSENKWMSGVNIIRKLAAKCGAKNPTLLRSTKFRKHVATTLQLLNMEEDEMEQIATFMGHTKKTHTEFYRLPQDIFQTAKVAKVLMLLERGKGKEFRGKNLNEIDLKDNDVYYSSESEAEEREVDHQQPLAKQILSKTKAGNQSVDVSSKNFNSDEDAEPAIKKAKVSEKQLQNTKCRIRWSAEEKKLVLHHFRHHINKKITPKKHECTELLANHKNQFNNKDWVKIKTLVYNNFRKT